VNRLFIELYLDEDVDILLAQLLKVRGFSALTTLDADQLGVDDESQLAFAAHSARSLLTHNRVDFEQLARRYHSIGQSHQGIIIAVRRTPQEILRRLLTILDQVTADEMENQIIYI